ncbi:hypothetical protein QWU01_12635 [Kluyvera cryocrescens]|uniref:Uncharacterized protein n=1 Tax=Kluyvera cryocrescens TaxID=580 RepID=A0AAW9C7N7_KLUCR|nr:hypothetical protein [Kluyvera cryocrescens]MDW3777654.1 hypothetical protein [Kluyvera cryocrescens]
MSDSLKDYAASTFGTAIQRIKNPAFGAFSLSWCVFNWKQLLYLFLSNTSVLDKIEYISTHSDWKTVIGYPILSSIVICGYVPWANLIISKWQAKPLDNTDSINNLREAKMLQRSTRLQRLQAKRDITYKKVTTGEEKVIQDMKEEIIKSKDSMGELTAELTAKNEELIGVNKRLQLATKTIDAMEFELSKLNDKNKELATNNEKLINTISDLKFKVATTTPVTGNGWLGSPSQLNEIIPRAGDKWISGNVADAETASKLYQKANSFLNEPNKNKKD